MPMLPDEIEKKSEAVVEKRHIESTIMLSKDLANVSTAIPGYFQLIKYYSCFAFLILLINSLYPIYATFYACQNFDPKHDICLEVGALYYL